MKTRPTRIQLLGEGRHEEGRAAADITPGDLIELTSGGTVRRHNGQAQRSERTFALEDALQGRGITDDYAAGELVSYCVSSPGDVVFARLGIGENIEIGDKLVSGGDGTLRQAGSGGEEEIAVALEAMDLSDSGSAVEVVTHIRCRVL